jgi:hypothetical protein
MKDILQAIGIFTIIVILVFIGAMIMRATTNGIESLCRHHYIKHRFDHPPMAACYCIDCQFHAGDGEQQMSGSAGRLHRERRF